MPQNPSAETLHPPKIRRSHTGCKPCRRRGKRCDETRPCCKACTRLSLDCTYGVDFSFRNINGALLQQRSTITRKVSPRPVVTYKPVTLRSDMGTNASTQNFNSIDKLFYPELPASLSSEDDLEVRYFNHFYNNVRHLLPAASLQFTEGSHHPPNLRFAILCISASNLSMLNAQVQSRLFPTDYRRSIFSPLANQFHHRNAQKYHDLALWHCRIARGSVLDHQAPSTLAAHVLLGYYHHASTDHLRFRLAVVESVQFVLLNTTKLKDSLGGADALQMWFRLCTSHRPAKPPALLLEGQGPSPSGPNLLPDVTEHFYLKCILGMSADDLIYDILIKTLEIRTKLAVFRSVADSHQISDRSSDIGGLAYGTLNKMLGRQCVPDEYAEAQQGFVQSSHLLGLLEIQKERVNVWRSRVRPDQLPQDCLASSSPTGQRFPTHRDSMNALYCLLCELTFEEAIETYASCGASPAVHRRSTILLGNIACSICQITGTVDLTESNILDVYTLSLTEVLLQLVLLWRSNQVFHYILDVLWPRLETSGRGFEHSHYPTHLVKRIISQVASLWEQGREITVALPAVPEDIPKTRLLDINHPVDMVVCGYSKDGKHFIEKVPLA